MNIGHYLMTDSLMVNNDHQCEHCDTVFCSQKVLKSHQNTAKYCLKIQGKILNIEYKCKYCPYLSTTKGNLKLHIDTCKSRIVLDAKTLSDKEEAVQLHVRKIEKDNEVLQKEIEVRKEFGLKFEKEAFKPKTTTNNLTQNNVITYMQEHLSSFTEPIANIDTILNNLYKLSHFTDGVESYSKFIVENILKDATGKLFYIGSNGKCYYKNQYGVAVLDENLSMLNQHVLSVMVDKTNKLNNKEEIDDDNRESVKKINKAIKRIKNDPSPVIKSITKHCSISGEKIKANEPLNLLDPVDYSVFYDVITELKTKTADYLLELFGLPNNLFRFILGHIDYRYDLFTKEFYYARINDGVTYIIRTKTPELLTFIYDNYLRNSLIISCSREACDIKIQECYDMKRECILAKPLVDAILIEELKNIMNELDRTPRLIHED